MKWRHWLHGLVSATIGGAASAVSAAVVAPSEFNLSNDGLKRLAVLAGVNGLMTAAAYLKQSPLPPENGNGRTVKEFPQK